MQQFHSDDTGKAQKEEEFSSSRRKMILGGAAGVAGIAGLALAGQHAFASSSDGPDGPNCVTPIKDILTIARTAERLAVTFYTHGLNHADQMGIHGDDQAYLRAALIEEQIHELFFAANGGGILASEFSFPEGPDTFTSIHRFIATQQQLEGVFDSAFLSAVREFAMQSRPDLAQISAQVACIEAEHRALGRSIAGLVPADNWAFTPVLIGKVGDAPALVKKAGYLSPTRGNSYTYHQVGTEKGGVVYRTPFAAACS